jgi:peptidyl-prolyl isomerase D
MPNTVCYFDITIAGESAGRITFELYDDLLPKVHHLLPSCGLAILCLLREASTEQ